MALIWNPFEEWGAPEILLPGSPIPGLLLSRSLISLGIPRVGVCMHVLATPLQVVDRRCAEQC